MLINIGKVVAEVQVIHATRDTSYIVMCILTTGEAEAVSSLTYKILLLSDIHMLLPVANCYFSLYSYDSEIDMTGIFYNLSLSQVSTC